MIRKLISLALLLAFVPALAVEYDIVPARRVDFGTRGSDTITQVTQATMDDLITSGGYANTLYGYFTGGILEKAHGGFAESVAAATGLPSFAAGVLSWTTNNSTNWNTAYTDRLKWDGGATGLVAATGRTSLELGGIALKDANDYVTSASLSTYGGTLIDDTDAATARSTLGLGSIAVKGDDDYVTSASLSTYGGTLIDDTDAATARGTLGLGSIAVKGDDDYVTSTSLSTYGGTLIDDTDAATARGTLGLGSIAVKGDDDYVTSASVSSYGATIIDDADAGTARTTLGLGTAATRGTDDFVTTAGTTTGDPVISGSMTVDSLKLDGSELQSNTDVTINVDADNNGTQSFIVQNGAGTNVATVSEAAALTLQDMTNQVIVGPNLIKVGTLGDDDSIFEVGASGLEVAGTTRISSAGAISGTTGTLTNNLTISGIYNLITASADPWHTNYMLQIGSNKVDEPDVAADSGGYGALSLKPCIQLTADSTACYGQTIKPFFTDDGNSRNLDAAKYLFIEGHDGAIGGTLTVDACYGLYINPMRDSATANYGAYIEGPSGTATDNIALYVTSPSNGTSNWSIRQYGTADNYFGANLTVGASEANPNITVGTTNSTGYGSISLVDRQTGGVTWLAGAGLTTAGNFGIRQSGVATWLTLVKTTGYMGVGTTTPQAQGHFVGDVTLTGTLKTGGDASTAGTTRIDASGVATLADGSTIAGIKHWGKLATAPASGHAEGDEYYDTATHKKYVFDGTSWQACW